MKRADVEEDYPWEPEFASTNGDVLSDVELGWEEFIRGRPAYLKCCLIIYGISNFIGPHHFQAWPPPKLTIDEVEELRSEFPFICDSEDMVAILNARGTVILNSNFHDTHEQKSIIKVATAAITLWAQWASYGPLLYGVNRRDSLFENPFVSVIANGRCFVVKRHRIQPVTDTDG